MGPLSTEECPRCRKYGTLYHDRHERLGRGFGLRRKYCRTCGTCLPLRSRSKFCPEHAELARKETARLRSQARRNRLKIDKQWSALTGPGSQKAVNDLLK